MRISGDVKDSFKKLVEIGSYLLPGMGSALAVRTVRHEPPFSDRNEQYMETTYYALAVGRTIMFITYGALSADKILPNPALFIIIDGLGYFEEAYEALYRRFKPSLSSRLRRFINED